MIYRHWDNPNNELIGKYVFSKELGNIPHFRSAPMQINIGEMIGLVVKVSGPNLICKTPGGTHNQIISSKVGFVCDNAHEAEELIVLRKRAADMIWKNLHEVAVWMDKEIEFNTAGPQAIV